MAVSVEVSLAFVFSLAPGVGQGCCVAPLHCNVFLLAVMKAWNVRTAGQGLEWITRIDGDLLEAGKV